MQGSWDQLRTVRHHHYHQFTVYVCTTNRMISKHSRYSSILPSSKFFIEFSPAWKYVKDLPFVEFMYLMFPCSGELRKLKSHLIRTQSLKVLPPEPGVGQCIVIHATLISTLPVPSPAFFQTSPDFFPVLAVANTGSCGGPQNKIGHPSGCRFPSWVLMEYK